MCHYSTSLDDENFPEALDFRLERWIRKDTTDHVDNFGSIPFGHGIRSCIGKRIAELEMHLSLTRVGLLNAFTAKHPAFTQTISVSAPCDNNLWIHV